MKSYENIILPEEETIRVQLIIGGLSFQGRDIKTATDFFMKVRINKNAGTVHQRRAGDRLYKITQAR